MSKAATKTEAEAPAAPIAHRPRYEPTKPMGSAGTLKQLMEAQRESLMQSLPKHVTPERLMKTLLVAVNRNPELLECTQASILETVSRAAELGLDLSGTLGEAYPVPFNNRIGDKWFKVCQLIIGYRGLAKLARQSGEIKRIEADVVHEKDDFVFRKGTDFALSFAPNLTSDRGAPIGAYALVEFKDGGLQAEFLPVEDVEKIRRRSKSGSDKQGNAIGAWKSDWSEMAKKTAFRRLAKWLPLSAEKLSLALEQDDEDYQPVVAVSNIQDGRTASQRLLGDLTGGDDAIDGEAVPAEREPGSDEESAELSWTGKLVAADEPASGKTNNKPWTIHRFHGEGGDVFSTFSATLAENVAAIMGVIVEVKYQETSHGKTILSVDPREPGMEG